MAATNRKVTSVEPHPFSYLRDRRGVIYTVLDNDPVRYGGHIRVAATYFPVDCDSTHRDEVSGLWYSKRIVVGYEVNPAESLDRMIMALSATATLDPISGEPILLLSRAEATPASNGRDRLRQLLNDDSEANCRLRAIFREAVSSLEECGIPLESLSLYGSLSSRLRRQGPVNDVDILVEGVSHYPHIVNLSKGNPIDLSAMPGEVFAKPSWRNAYIRRWQLSQFELQRWPGLKVDVRILPTAAERSALFDVATRITKNSRFDGCVTITNADYSLSLPSVYRDTAENGEECVIRGCNFFALGAATVGDTVHVCGSKVGSTIHLGAPLSDHIVTL
jgi:hypothetical protein